MQFTYKQVFLDLLQRKTIGPTFQQKCPTTSCLLWPFCKLVARQPVTFDHVFTFAVMSDRERERGGGREGEREEREEKETDRERGRRERRERRERD